MHPKQAVPNGARQSSSQSPRGIGWLFAGLLFALLGGAKFAPAAELTPLDARIRELREALPTDVEQANDDDLAGIAQIVERLFGSKGISVGEQGGLGWLSGLFKTQDRAQELAKSFDVERMFGPLETQDVDRPGISRSQFRKQVEQSFFTNSAKLPLLMHVADCRVRRLHLHEDQGEAELYTKQRQGDGEISYGHYWLCKRDGVWRIRELEESLAGVRYLSSRIAEHSLTGDERQQWKKAENALLSIREHLKQEDYVGAEDRLDSIADLKLAPDLEIMRLLSKCNQLQGYSEPVGALEYVEKLEVLRPQAAFVLLERAECLILSEKFADALPVLLQLQELIGPQAEVYHNLGKALFALGDTTGAVQAHRQGLVENILYVENLTTLMRNMPKLPRHELDELFAKIRLTDSIFEQIGVKLYMSESLTALEALVERYRQIAPDFYAVDDFAAEVLASRRQFKEAAEGFKAGMIKHGTKSNFQERYVDCMLELDRGFEAYRNAIDPEEAFQQLARQCDDRGNYRRGLLEQLIAAHRERVPNAPQLLMYEARLKEMQKDHLAAAELLLKGWKKSRGDRWFWRFQYLEAMEAADRPFEAYDALSQDSEVFEQLADRFVSREEPDQLEKLLKLREKSHPTDPRLTAYRARLLLLREKPEEAVALLRPLLNGKTVHYEQEIFLDAMVACGKPVDAYLESPLRERSFSYLVVRVDGDDLEKLLAAARVREPENSDLIYYSALSMIQRDEQAQAVAYLRGAMVNAAPDDLKQLLHLYLSTARELYGIVPTYDGAPDAKQAFENLALTCHYSDDFDSMEKLVAAHRKRAPEDKANLALYAARVHAHYQRVDQAIAEYELAIANDEKQQVSSTCRSERLDLWVKSGKIVEIYKRDHDKKERFSELAYACLSASDTTQLAALVEAHRPLVAEPDDMLTWDAELLVLRRDDEGVVKLLLNRPANAARWDTTDEYLVRSLIRLKRYDEAAPIADRLDHNVPFYTAMVAGSRGDVAAAIAAMEQCIKHGHYTLDAFGADDILGPLLNTPPFEEFWKKQKAIEDGEDGKE